MKYLFFIFCLFVFLPYSFSQQIKKYKEDYFFVYGGGEMYGSDPRFISPPQKQKRPSIFYQ